MRYLLTSALLSVGLASSLAAAPIAAGPVTATSVNALTTADHSAQLWLAKDNGKGHGKDAKAEKPAKGNKGNKAKGHGKDKQARGKDKTREIAKGKPDKPGKAHKQQARNDKPDKALKAGKGKLRGPDWDKRAEEVLRVKAPADRDMLTLLGGVALTLAGPQLVVADTPIEQLITYRNCPPGLAKKTPACVPPGLAKQGVTQEQWLSYDDAEYDRLWLRQRDDYLRRGLTPSENLLLQSAQIARLFGLAPAPNGQRYALIDGMPVLLDQEDYTGLLLINELAQVADIGNGLNVAPTAALTQYELSRLYRLPAPGPDVNYAVLNGQVIRLSDSQYETLQLIRIARAVL